MSSQVDNNRDRLRRIYNHYRTAWMSREYYACRLAYLQKCNLWYEILLAVGASGSVIAGWYIWKTSVGQPVWAVFSGAVAVLAILKPILQIPAKVERYSMLFTGYAALTYDYKKLTDEIKATRGITPEMRELLSKADERFRELNLKDDPKPKEKLLRECQATVNKHAPNFDVWYPQQTA